MKNKSIRFFSLQDNTLAKSKKETTKAPIKPAKLEGYVSSSGKLVIPSKTFEQLDLPTDTAFLQVGTDAGKRKIKTLYLLSTDSGENGFELVKAAKSYSIQLAKILEKGGIDYNKTKYSFTLDPFTDENGTGGYSLKLSNDQPKPVYNGKPRGRKPKSVSQE